jgi:hypothetical protein
MRIFSVASGLAFVLVLLTLVAPFDNRPAGVGAATLAKAESAPAERGVDAKLDANLADWETASSKIRRIDYEFEKFVYDPVFEIERRGRGDMAVERNGLARYRVVPAVLGPEAILKKGKDGSPHILASCQAETWLWTETQLVRLNDQERTYEKIEVEPSRGSRDVGFFQIRITSEWLDLMFFKPFTLGTPGKLKERFNMRQMKATDDELWLELIPRRAADSGSFANVTLILDRRTWLTRALRVRDPTGCQTVYVFHNIKVNSEVTDDLSQPSLEGYREVLGNETVKTETFK